jgi:hypothetical protein
MFSPVPDHQPEEGRMTARRTMRRLTRPIRWRWHGYRFQRRLRRMDWDANHANLPTI